MSEKVTRITPCPNCGKTSKSAEDNPWRPFCSERCKLVDLGDWLTEKNVIATPLQEGDEVPQTDNSEEELS